MAKYDENKLVAMGKLRSTLLSVSASNASLSLSIGFSTKHFSPLL